ncbi:Acetyltransferase (GNAT) family protein [Austwickia chelonae]|nr:Acetyltransferase (GNAT) family protein [Austwickia chelonae]
MVVTMRSSHSRFMLSFAESLASVHPSCSLEDFDCGVFVRACVPSPRALFSFCLPSEGGPCARFTREAAEHLACRQANGVIWDFDEVGAEEFGFCDARVQVEALQNVRLMHLTPRAYNQQYAARGRGSVYRLGNKVNPGAYRALHDVQCENFGLGELGVAERAYVLEQELFRSGRQRAVVVFSDGIPVASGNMWIEGQMACLFWIYTLRRVRGHGFGGQVVQELCRWAAECECREVLLQATMAGEKLYKQLGFQDDGGA